MDWQLAIVDGLYKIEDVAIDGVSVGLTHRSQIQAMISRSAGQVWMLLATMRQED
jgi:ABC-type transporter MlaC component